MDHLRWPKLAAGRSLHTSISAFCCVIGYAVRSFDSVCFSIGHPNGKLSMVTSACLMCCPSWYPAPVQGMPVQRYSGCHEPLRAGPRSSELGNEWLSPTRIAAPLAAISLAGNELSPTKGASSSAAAIESFATTATYTEPPRFEFDAPANHPNSTERTQHQMPKGQLHATHSTKVGAAAAAAKAAHQTRLAPRRPCRSALIQRHQCPLEWHVRHNISPRLKLKASPSISATPYHGLPSTAGKQGTRCHRRCGFPCDPVHSQDRRPCLCWQELHRMRYPMGSPNQCSLTP